MTSLLRFARTYMTPYLHWYVPGVVLLFVTNTLSVTIPLYVGQAIDVLRTGSDPSGEVPRIAGMVALMGLAIIVVRTASRLLFFTPGRLVEAQVKRDLFQKLLSHQPPFHRGFPPGDLISRMTSDVNFLRLVAGFVALSAFNSIAAIGLTVAQMVRLSPELAFWVLIPVAVGMGVVQLFIRRMFVLVKRMQQEVAVLSDHILSSYQGVASIQAFNAQPAFVEVFDRQNDAYLTTSLRRADMRAAIGPTLSFSAAFNVFLLLYVGGPMAVAGEITVGDLVAFTTLLGFLSGPLRGFSFLISASKQAQAALERIDAVTEVAVERPDLDIGAAAPSGPPQIEVKNLDFSYPDDPDTMVLHDVSFTLPAGATLGILGPTGSGKTTLLRCLSRLYNPPAGTVFSDGVDIRTIDLPAWRRGTAYVPQRAFLFAESVQDNIMLGETDAGRLQQVLGLTAMHVDIEALPDGVNTQVGETGVMLSGGQRQRVALARGLVREPAMLILDDVMSAVDHATEAQLIASLGAREVAPTTIIVANRLSAIRHADLIVVVVDGRVVDRGTHAELAARPGFYQDTWQHQNDAGQPA